MLFEYDWFRSKEDGFGFTLVNIGKLIFQNDPFAFATQVKHLYSTKDPTDDWHVVTSTIPRDLFDIYGDFENGEMEKHTTAQLRSLILDQYSHENEDVNWVRDDILGTKIDTCVLDHQEIRERSQHG